MSTKEEIKEEIQKELKKKVKRLIKDAREINEQLWFLEKEPHSDKNIRMRELIILRALLEHRQLPEKTSEKVHLLAQKFVLKNVLALLSKLEKNEPVQLKQEYARINRQTKAILQARQLLPPQDSQDSVLANILLDLSKSIV